MAVRFVAVGHVTRDEFPGETDWRLGGTVMYAAATAARLGTRAALVTRVGPQERDRLADRCAALGIELHALPAEVTTTFVFRYLDGRRSLRLRSRARGLTLSDVPPTLRDADAVVLGSVAREIDRSLLGAFSRAATVLTAQGYLREWDADGTVRARPWDDAAEVVPRVSAVVLSDEDVNGDLAAPRQWAAYAPVIVTLGERGALVIAHGKEQRARAQNVNAVIDPTGAGDAFAAGLAIVLAEGGDLLSAARFANSVASFAVEGVGTAGLADRTTVEARMGAGFLR